MPLRGFMSLELCIIVGSAVLGVASLAEFASPGLHLALGLMAWGSGQGVLWSGVVDGLGLVVRGLPDQPRLGGPVVRWDGLQDGEGAMGTARWREPRGRHHPVLAQSPAHSSPEAHRKRATTGPPPRGRHTMPHSALTARPRVPLRLAIRPSPSKPLARDPPS